MFRLIFVSTILIVLGCSGSIKHSHLRQQTTEDLDESRLTEEELGTEHEFRVEGLDPDTSELQMDRLHKALKDITGVSLVGFIPELALIKIRAEDTVGVLALENVIEQYGFTVIKNDPEAHLSELYMCLAKGRS